MIISHQSHLFTMYLTVIYSVVYFYKGTMENVLQLAVS